MPSAACPKCGTEVPVSDADTRSGRSFRCPGCGVSVPLRRGPEEPVAFPKAKNDETMLDLSEAVRAVRRKRAKKESS
jgi:DNA-directed RNA polymerase subunit RPC12/RpoP